MCKIRNCCHSLVIKDYRFLKLLFTILALFLICEIFYTWLVLKPTYTSNERRQISPEDFPEIIICPEPPLNISALRLRGYGSIQSYFHGDRYGWTGKKAEDLKKVDGHGSGYILSKFEFIKAVNPHHICLK